MRFLNQLGTTIQVDGVVIRPNAYFESDDEKYCHMIGIKKVEKDLIENRGDLNGGRIYSKRNRSKISKSE